MIGINLVIGIISISISIVLILQFYKLKKKGYDRNSGDYLKAIIAIRVGLFLCVFGLIYVIIFLSEWFS